MYKFDIAVTVAVALILALGLYVVLLHMVRVDAMVL